MKVRYLFIISVAVATLSCQKYLEKKSDSSLVVPSTIEDFQSLLDDAENINYNRTSNYAQASSDEYFTVNDIYYGLSEEDRKMYTWRQFDYFIHNDWSSGYLPIYVSNLCLENIENIEQTNQNLDKWNNVKGSSLFLRSYYFVKLLWAYSKAYDENSAQSDLGIVLRLTSDFNIISTRSSVKDCYEQAIKDVKESITYLPDIPQHVLRPSKAAAFGLLARVYLSMRQYDSAFKYSDLCLSIKNTLMDYNSDISGGNVPFKRFNSETIFYSEVNGNFLSIDAITIATIDTTLFATYESNDIRRSAFFRNSNFSPGNKRLKATYTGQFKYFSGIATDEMFLIRAECYARKANPNKEEAMNDLNTLLIKRYAIGSFVPLIAASEQEAIDFVLLERKKELLLRGLRWMDIKRLNKEGANIVLKRNIDGQTYTLEPNSNFYALPLPKDIIDQTGMPQN